MADYETAVFRFCGKSNCGTFYPQIEHSQKKSSLAANKTFTHPAHEMLDTKGEKMNIKLAFLVKSLQQLENAYDKLSRGVPDPRTAETTADRALESVTNLLSDKELVDNLDALIIEARKEFEANATKFDAPSPKQKQELFSAEIKVLRNSGLREEDIIELYAIFQKVKHEKGQFVSNSEELRGHLEALHKTYKAEIEASRQQPRKEKKKRKRRVLQGIVSTTLGTGVIIANSQFPPLFAFSYGLGGGALHQAVRDFIGDPPE